MSGNIVSYQVWLVDTSGSRVAVFDDWISLTFTKVVNGIGSFRFTIDGNDSRVALFGLDCMIQIYRTIPSVGLSLYKEFEGLHVDEDRNFTEQGKKTYTSIGVTLIDFINRRIIGYPSGHARASMSAVAGETAMKNFVEYNLGATATTGSGRQSDSVMTGLTIQADSGLGSVFTGERSYKNLLDVLRDISNVSTVDFDIIGTGGATFQFRTYNGQRGADRSITGLDPITGLNSAGNFPVIFSVQSMNLTNVKYSVSRIKEINSVFVLGQGIDSGRQVVNRKNTISIAESPWNLREGKIDARNENSTNGLNAIGDSKLTDMKARLNLDGTILQAPSSTYGLHYNFGDKITFRYDTVVLNRKIISVEITTMQGKEVIKPKFSDVI